MASYSISKLTTYLEDHIEDREPYWKCPAHTNAKPPTRCNRNFGKRIEKDNAKSLHQLLQEFHQKTSQPDTIVCKTLDDANGLLEKLVCSPAHRWRVLVVIQDYLRQPLPDITVSSLGVGMKTPETNGTALLLVSHDGTVPRETHHNAQATRPKTPRKAMHKQETPPTTPQPRSRASFTPKTPMSPGDISHMTDNFRNLSVSPPWSELLTPASSVGSMDSVFSASKSPLTPDTVASTGTWNPSRSSSNDTPTKRGSSRNLLVELEDDEDPYIEDMDECGEAVQEHERRIEYGTLKNTPSGVRTLNLPQPQKQRRTPQRAVKANQTSPGQPQTPVQATRQSVKPFHGDKFTLNENTRFDLALLIEKDLGKTDKEEGILYIANTDEADLKGHYKFGWTRNTVCDRYKTEKCYRKDDLKFLYRSPDRFRGAYRVERLVHMELALERRRISDCDKCHGRHREWFEVGLQELRESVERWSRFLLLPAYTIDGKLSVEVEKLMYGMWTWNAFMGELTTRTQKKSHKMVDINPPVDRLGMKAFEDDLANGILAMKNKRPPMPRLSKITDVGEDEVAQPDTSDAQISLQAMFEIDEKQRVPDGEAARRERVGNKLAQGDSENRDPSVVTVKDVHKSQANNIGPVSAVKDAHNTKSKTNPLEALKDFGRRVRGNKAAPAVVGPRSPIDTEEVGPKVGIQRRWTDFLGKSKKH